MQEALSWMRSNGEETGVEDIARLSPLMHGHINMLSTTGKKWVFRNLGGEILMKLSS